MRFFFINLKKIKLSFPPLLFLFFFFTVTLRCWQVLLMVFFSSGFSKKKVWIILGSRFSVAFFCGFLNIPPDRALLESAPHPLPLSLLEGFSCKNVILKHSLFPSLFLPPAESFPCARSLARSSGTRRFPAETNATRSGNRKFSQHIESLRLPPSPSQSSLSVFLETFRIGRIGETSRLNRILSPQEKFHQNSHLTSHEYPPSSLLLPVFPATTPTRPVSPSDLDKQTYPARSSVRFDSFPDGSLSLSPSRFPRSLKMLFPFVRGKIYPSHPPTHPR